MLLAMLRGREIVRPCALCRSFRVWIAAVDGIGVFWRAEAGWVGEGDRRGGRQLGGARRGLDKGRSLVERVHGGICECLNGRAQRRRMWSAARWWWQRCGSRAVRHHDSVPLGLRAKACIVVGGVLRNTGKAIASDCRAGNVASGACWRHLLRAEDRRERLPDGARRSGGARRSLPVLRLEGGAPHGDMCGRGGWTGGGASCRRCRAGAIVAESVGYGTAAL
jgi:hypothetical protein